MSKKTIDELKAELAAAEAEQRAEQHSARKNYEKDREALIEVLAGEAYKLAVLLSSLKSEAIDQLNAFRIKMLEYGELRGGQKNKGSFELKHGQWKITFTSQIVKKFDERAFIAEKHINEFLKSFLRKKDKATHELVSNLLQRDEESGQFDIDMINRLYSMKETFHDPNWIKGLELFQESYVPYHTAQYVRFFQLNEATNAYEPLILDFAKVKLIELAKTS